MYSVAPESPSARVDILDSAPMFYGMKDSEELDRLLVSCIASLEDVHARLVQARLLVDISQGDAWLRRARTGHAQSLVREATNATREAMGLVPPLREDMP